MKLKTTLLALLLSLAFIGASQAAGHFANWPDDAICTWVKIKPNNVGYQTEAANRGLSCGGMVTASDKTSKGKLGPTIKVIK